MVQGPELTQSIAVNKVSKLDKAKALESLDHAGFTWFQLRTLITAGTGFFTDAYDIFAIGLVVPMLGYIYYADSGNAVPSSLDGPLKGMTAFGTLIGQLTFGYVGDVFGRQKIYGLELLIIIVATIGCATSASTVRGIGALAFLGFWRLILGIGIGGDYPMSATITSEWAPAHQRGMFMSFIFSMQGVGNFVAAIVSAICLTAFKDLINEDQLNLDYVWRLILGFGAVPAVATVYLRMIMPETPRYSLNVEGDAEKAADAVMIATGKTVKDDDKTVTSHVAPTSKERQRKHNADFIAYFSKWKNAKVLLGTSLSWFFLDIAFYGLGLNQSYILSSIGYAGDGLSPYEKLYKQAIGNLIISSLGFVPGYYFTVFLAERMGRKTIQLMGFTMLTILFIILSAGFYAIKNTSVTLFIMLFTMAQFFFNFGPNTTTFVIAGEVFPTKVRATAHGISAAAGKAGAIISTFGFNSLVEIGDTKPKEQAFLPQTLGIFAVVMFLGLLSTFLVPETKGRSLEEFEDYYEAEEDGDEPGSTKP